MATQEGQQRQQQQPQSQAEQRVREYMLGGEEISYSLRFRPTGIINWIKSLFGFGVTHWFVTNQRLIQETRVGGGFAFKDVPHGKISSVEYGSKVSLLTVAAGVLLGLFGLVSLTEVAELGLVLLLVGAGLVAYAFWRRRQVLSIQASGGVTIALSISKGQQVDEFLWYLHAEREKRT